MNKTRGGRANKIFFIAAYIILCLFLLFVIVEAAGRVYLLIKFGKPSNVSYTPFGYEREPLLGFEMVPNTRNRHLKYLKTTFSTNSKGFRGREEYSKKEKNELRVAILGESSAFGYGAGNDDTTIAGYLKKDLEQGFPSCRISVINAANPGYTSYQILAKLQLRVIELEPDFVVLYMGWNDLFYSSYNLPYERNSFYGKDFYFAMDSWQAFIKAKNRDISGNFLKPFATTIFFKKIYANLKRKSLSDNSGFERPAARIVDSEELRKEILKQFYDNFSSILAIARFRNIRPITVSLFSDIDLCHQDRRDINSVIIKATEEQLGRLIDADKIVSDNHISGINIPNDGYHLTDKGNKFLADIIAKKIIESASIKNKW